MKTFKLISFFTLIFFLLVVLVRCGDDSKTVTLGSLTGTVMYPNTSGTQTAAENATVTLMGTSGTLITITGADGSYSFPNLKAAEYDLSASLYVQPANARMEGLNFATAADVTVTVGSKDLSQNLTLVSVGQSGADIIPIVANYAWNGTNSAYEQPTNPAWQLDNNHSLVTFEFPYRDEQADFTGSFKQIHKFVVTFDPANLAGSSIDVEVDMASVDTRTPGGRDNRTTAVDNPVFSPASSFTEFGCIAGTFGIDAGSYTFTVTSANATAGATYSYTNPTTNVVSTFTVVSTIAGSTTLECTAIGNAPKPGAGTLTKSTGTGDATITIASFIAPTAPSDANPKQIMEDNAADRYAKFASSSIAKYGDGYLAKGNLVWRGFTVPVELWFKEIPTWFDASNSRTFSGFEGKFLMDAKNDFGILSSSINAAILRIQISVVGYTQG